MKAIGFVMFMVGACGMDSEYLFIPVMLIGIGLALICAGRRNYDDI